MFVCLLLFQSNKIVYPCTTNSECDNTNGGTICSNIGECRCPIGQYISAINGGKCIDIACDECGKYSHLYQCSTQNYRCECVPQTSPSSDNVDCVYVHHREEFHLKTSPLQWIVIGLAGTVIIVACVAIFIYYYITYYGGGRRHDGESKSKFIHHHVNGSKKRKSRSRSKRH